MKNLKINFIKKKLDDDDQPLALRHGVFEEVRSAKYERASPVIRRTGLHHKLLERDVISRAAWEVVERYSAAYERVEGASDGKPLGERVDCDAPQSFFPARVNAASFLRRCDGKMALGQRQILIAGCVLAWPITELAEKVIGIPRRRGEALDAYRSRVKRRVGLAALAAINALVPPRAGSTVHDPR